MRRRGPNPTPAEPAPSDVAEPLSWAVQVRPEGARYRCVILQLAGTRVTAEVVGDIVDRGTALGYAQGAVYSLTLGTRPHLPNAVLTEIEP